MYLSCQSVPEKERMYLSCQSVSEKERMYLSCQSVSEKERMYLSYQSVSSQRVSRHRAASLHERTPGAAQVMLKWCCGGAAGCS